jgi:DNA-binding HxlR family transcriptional regulator
MKPLPKNPGLSVCSIDHAFRSLGGKYKARILLYLWYNKVLRYGELRRTIADIAPKMLTQTLRELEEDGLVSRTVFNEKPPRVDYTITASGLSFVPFIRELKKWGDQLLDKHGVQALPPLVCEEFGPVDAGGTSSSVNG